MGGRTKLELSYLSLGKAYGYKGDDLRKFVEEKTIEAEAEAEKRRVIARDERERAREIELELAKVKGRTASGNQGNDSPDSSHRRVKALEIPKFNGKQSVEKYLEVFESVAKLNGYAESDWPVVLRSCTLETKLYSTVESGSSYKEIKQELLLQYGVTADRLWKDLVSVHQNDESFRQYSTRVVALLKQWCSMSMAENPGEGAEVIVEVLAKQLIMASLAKDMKAFLLERKAQQKSLEEFVVDASSYQEAHGRPSKTREKEAKSTTVPATHAFKVTVEETVSQLQKMSVASRREFVMSNSLCRNCLKPGHRAFRCVSQARCGTCGSKHHTLLHQDGQKQESHHRGSTPSQPGIQTTAFVNSGGATHLMTAVARVRGQRGATIRVLLDSGSQASFVSKALVDAVKPVQVSSTDVTIQAFGVAPVSGEAGVVELKLYDAKDKEHVLHVVERGDLALGIAPHSEALVRRWKERGVELSDVRQKHVNEEIHLLIGADYVNQFLINKMEVDGEVAWQTLLGWVLSGPEASEKRPQPLSTTFQVNCVQSDIQALWELEQPVRTSSSNDNWPAFPLSKNEGGYEVGLLWRNTERPPDNRQQALAAATSLEKKLARSGKREAYDAVLLDEYQKLGAIEREPNPGSPGYYMPHHAVVRDNASTTKLRVVFNASATSTNGQSLNSLTDAGPSLLPDLTGLLLRFREFEHAAQADIRKAFFMVSLREEDRPYVRFVWPDSEGVMTTWRLTKVPFGVNCSPFLLNAVLQTHLRDKREVVSDDERNLLDLLGESLYVDDCAISVEREDEVDRFREFSVSLLEEAGMDLRKWKRSHGESDTECGSKVLGVTWDEKSDMLSFSPDSLPEPPECWTRRALLKQVSSLFDPLGLVAPLILPGKIYLQQSWKEGGDWDDPLSESLARKVSAWWGEISQMSTVGFKRWIGVRLADEITIHLFCDASESAYGCSIYLATSEFASLLYGKAKVCPLKQQSLAKMELQAAFVGVKWLAFVLEHLRVRSSTVIAWTDSMTTWHWIRQPPHRWKTYVANRVSDIQRISEQFGVTWKHCPGRENPADHISRGLSVEQLCDSNWLCGPPWLCDSDQFPSQPQLDGPPDEAMDEARLSVSFVKVGEDDAWWNRVSSWKKVVDITATILKWRFRSMDEVDLWKRAEQVVIKLIQTDCFATEIDSLQHGRKIPQSSSLLQLKPFLDKEGLLRVGGRLQHAEIDYDARHPIILGRHHLTELLLRHMHWSRKHEGVESMLAFVRQRYHVIGCRRLAKKLKQKCVVCRRFDAKTADQETAPLPEDRVNHRHPFYMTGVDHAGPLYVKDQPDGSGSKVWIVLFVCGTTRAVHLETVSALSAKEFLMAYRRFLARRGQPSLIRSDNGTAFKSSAEILSRSVKWQFNPPASPWHGGFFERLVRAVKSPLRKVLGRAMLHRTELDTLIVEVEALVNSRPLTHASVEDRPLTPAALLGNVWSNSGPDDLEHQVAAAFQRRHQYVVEKFRELKKRWHEEYLLQLRTFQAGRNKPVRVNDVVLLVESDKRRQFWKLGRVRKLFRGKDGLCRVAEVQVGTGVMIRPVQKLVPLEVDSGPEEEESKPVVLEGKASAIEARAETPVVQPRVQVSVPVVRTRTRVIVAPRRMDL